MAKNVYKIRKVTDYSIADLLNDNVSASTPECFDDKTEMEWYCDYDKVVKAILNKRAIGMITESEFENIFANYSYLSRDEEGLKKLIGKVVDPNDVPQKKSLLVSCMSLNNTVDNESMWESYTGGKQYEGFMLVYDIDTLKSNCNDSIICDEIKYDDRKKLDITDYWVDWFYCFCKYVDYSKTMLENKVRVDSEMKKLKHEYISIQELIFTKNNDWKWQKEWRIAKENPNYSYDIGEYSIDGHKVEEKDYYKCKYGFTIKAKPKAIYVRKHVYNRYIEKIKKYASNNKIPVFYENKIGDKERFKAFN